MKNLTNIEVFHIETKENGMYAHISFQNLDNIDDVNNGYDWKVIPINPREVQLSAHDNPLVDQSVKNHVDVAISNK